MASSSNSLHESQSWKEQPCHFTWNLADVHVVLIDYEHVIRKIDHDLEATPFLLRVDKLLFRAYLEVSDHRLHRDGRKAQEFLDEADEYITSHTEPELQPGYRSVALLNRMWIEDKMQRPKEVNKLLCELGGLKLGETDKLVVNTLLANALSRLGTSMITRSLQIYEKAVEEFPENAGFLFGAILMTGRKMRFERSGSYMYKDLDEDGKELMNQEKTYCEKLIEVDDEYQFGAAYLGQNLSRRGETAEARELLEKAHKKAPYVTAVFHNLMKFYRYNTKDIPLSKLQKIITQKQSLDVPESHNQLALCFFAMAETDQKKKYREDGLNELNKCLAIDKMHYTAALRKAQELPTDEAKALFENMLLTTKDHYTPKGKLRFYFDYAKFLKGIGDSSHLDRWKTVMKLTSPFDYFDNKSCKWRVGAEAKAERAAAYEQLFRHYSSDAKWNLKLGILHFQNLHFEEAIRRLSLLDPTTNLDIPCYLAEAYLKWGNEKEMSNEPEAVGDYTMAHYNVLRATKLGLNQKRGRELLSDTALAIAHSNLYTYPSERSHTGQSLTAVIPIESDCIKSYREAVRCGSLVASLEVLRLIEKDFLQKTPRSKFLQTLAEIDICCSQRLSDCLHRDMKPRSFKNGPNSRDTDIDTFALDCKKIKRVILTTLHQNTFFGQAWAQHFAMEKKVLEKRFRNNEGELELDERKESSTQNDSTEEVYAAIDCCGKLRPLLDHIIAEFEKCELGSQEERRKQYFPLVFGEKDSVRIEEVLQEKLQSYFEINFEEHYPDLYKKLVQVQPGCNPQNDFLEKCYTLVNHVKHSGIQTQEISKIVQDPVKLARQCTDKVEEICNYFFDAMKESSDLREKVEELVTDLKCSGHASSSRQGMDEAYEKAAEFLRILTDHQDFIVRMGSTWKFLEMLAIVRQSTMHSYQRTLLEQAENKLAEGTWDPSKILRKYHLELEVSLLQTADPSANKVLEKCRDTCKEADILLKEVMKKNRQGPHDDTEVEFPFRDMQPGGDKDSWEGKVKKDIKKYLSKKGINPAKELMKVILQAQPCSNEENYNFLLMQEFLKKCEGASGVPSSVSIKIDNGEVKLINAVDLTRWCTNYAEKIASQALQGT